MFHNKAIISFIFASVAALNCPDNGKVILKYFFHFYLFPFSVDETNVTDYMGAKNFKSWKRPVKHFDSTVEVKIDFYLLNIISVVRWFFFIQNL